MSCLLLFVFLISTSLCLNSSPASAQSHRKLSDEETRTLGFALEHFDRQVDTNPGTKLIGNILVYSANVFDEKSWEGIQWANHLRVKTRDEVIRQELLIEEGDVFHWSAVEDNELLLIGAGFNSIVVIVPVQPTDPTRSDQVDLLVVTRDIWSLRLSSDFETAGNVVNFLFLSLTESNLFGYNKIAQVSFLMRQKNYDIGARYMDPNVGGERYRLDVNQGFVFNRQTGDMEGHYAGASFGLPLYSRRSKFGYELSTAYRADVYRNLIGDQIAPFKLSGYDEDDDVYIPWEYPRESVSGSLIFKRGFGYKYRHILRFGYGASWYNPKVPEDLGDDTLTARYFKYSIEQWQQFSSYFITGYHFFEWKFARLYNYNTFALAEYILLGPSVDFEINWASSALLYSDRDYIFFSAKAYYTWLLGRDGLFRVLTSAATRLEKTFRSKYLGTGLRVVSPNMGRGGRFVFAGNVDVVLDPVQSGNPIYARGGETGLRGLVYQALQGNNFAQTNIEYRSPSASLKVIRLGAVAFHDMGSTFHVGGMLEPIHSVGGGIRILILSANRDVLRIDYGVPVNGATSGFKYGLITAGYGQAF